MEKFFEFYTTWLKSQQDFLNNWFRYQTELMGNWLEGVKSLQMPFSVMAGSKGGSQHFSDLYTSWLSVMTSSSKAYIEGITNFQNAWKTMIGRQMEMGKETSKQVVGPFKEGKETR